MFTTYLAAVFLAEILFWKKGQKSWSWNVGFPIRLSQKGRGEKKERQTQEKVN